MSNLSGWHCPTVRMAFATHSPYFALLDSLGAGATVARVHVRDGNSIISQLTQATGRELLGLIRNANTPHILGLNSQEIFFIEDEVILVEGQEDVVFFKKVKEQLCPDLRGTFFGWGVGGAENMPLIAQVLLELGFERVAGILDRNKADLARALRARFPRYRFSTIAADDVRTKRAQPARAAIDGLLNEANNAVRPELVAETRTLLGEIQRYFNPDNLAA